MVQNSFNSKGYFNGQSAAALKDPSHIHQQKKEESEKEPSSIKVRKRYFQIFLALFLMIATLQGYSQSGISCSLSKNLGSGASYKASESFNMPSGDIWMKYTNPAGAVRISMIPDTVGGANSLKFKEISIYLDSCGGQQLFYYSFDTTQAIPFNYLLNKIPVYSNVYIYVKRYVDAGCGGCDTVYKSFSLTLTSNNNLLASVECDASTCTNNLVKNGNFEQYTNLIDLNLNWDYNICGWSSVFNYPDYFNTDNTTYTDVDIPGNGTGYPPATNKYYIDVPPLNYWYSSATNNKGVVGLSLDDNSNDVITGNLSANLVSGKKYFLSFDASNSGRPNYAGRLDVDISDQSIYDPNASDFNFVDLQFSGDVLTYKAIWQNFQTVITSTGNESYLHIGNLKPTTNNSVTPQTAYVVGTDQEYIFMDNFALVPLAFAGADVTLCAATTAELGACEIPGATYSWSPSTGLSSTTVANPIVTGQGYSIAYTVTVTITIGATTYTDTDVINVINGGTTVTLGASPLVLTTAGTTVLTALPAGMGTYAFYDMASPGIILQSTSSNTFTTGSLGASATYGVNLTDANGCTAETTINILYTATPCSTGSPLTHISSNSTSQLTAGPYSGVAFDVSDGFIFNSDVTFTNCEFWMRDGATVNINSAQTVTLDYSLVRQCDKMWNRISNSGTIKANNTRFTQGDRAVVIKSGSNNVFLDCNFNDNVYGISSLESGAIQTVELTVTGTTFRGLNGFVTGYFGQTPFHTLPAAGILLRDLSPQIIGNDGSNYNLFTNQYLGIINENSNLTVNNSYFDQFTILNPTVAVPPAPAPYPTNVYPYVVSGTAIYGLQGGSGSFLTTVNGAPAQDYGTNATIRNAQFKGIIMDKMATDILNVNITNCTVGINLLKLLPSFNSRILNCSLNVSNTGIFIYSSSTLSTIIIQENLVEVNPLSGDPKGLSCIRIDNPNGTSNNASIRVISNDIRTTGANNGIYLQNCAGGGAYVSCNTITKSFDGTFQGIKINYSGGSIIKTNTISSTNPFTNSGNSTSSNSGIEVNISPSIKISCNTTNNFFIGLSFLGDNSGSGRYLSGNSMGTHYWGLSYSASATVGHCDNRGNLWTVAAPTSGFHARNNNFAQLSPTCVPNSPNQYLINRIITGTPNGSNTNITSSFPTGLPNVTNPCLVPAMIGLDNTGWITNQANIADYDSCGYQQDSCAIWTSMRSTQSVEEMEMIAKSENIASDFNDESKYMVKQTLFDYLEKNPDVKENSEVLDSLYTVHLNSSIGKNNNVKNLIEQGSPAYIMNLLSANLINLNNASAMLAYTIKNNGNIANAKINYENYLNENLSINEQLKGVRSSKKLLAALNNNSIITDNIVSYNNKLITQIYLTQIYGVDSIDLTSSISTILSIANQCPYVGGPAVYWARGIYEMVVPGLIYIDDSVCTTISNERRGSMSNTLIANNAAEKSIIDNQIIAYPNPTDGLYNIEISSEYLNSELQIIDILGKVVFEQKVSTLKSTFNLNSLNKGSYIISIRNNYGTVYHNKLIIK